MASSSTTAAIPVEVLQEQESSLQGLIDLSILIPALEGRPVLAPMIPDLKTSIEDSISPLIQYIVKQGHLAATAFLAALQSTADRCDGHKRAIELLTNAANASSSKLLNNKSSQSEGGDSNEGSSSSLLNILRDATKELEAHIDVLPLLPRLMQQNVITSAHFRELRAPYMSQVDRIQRLVTALESSGIDGLIQLVLTLKDSKDIKQKQVAIVLVSKSKT